MAAQIAAAFFTGRREKKRFEWDKKQTFSDDKRAVFVALLRQAELMHALLTDCVAAPEDDAAAAIQKLETTKDKWWEEWTERVVEIRLMAPSVAPAVKELTSLFAEWHHEAWSDGPPDGNFYEDLSARYVQAVERIEPEFQESLGLVVTKKR